MIQILIDAWNERKNELEEYFKTTPMGKYDSYEDLIKLVFEKVVNPEMPMDYLTYDVNRMTVIDDGDYQGTLLFLIPRKTYQPSVDEYIYTSVYYGSCCVCDVLERIHVYSYDALPNEKQVAEYMTLCLHLLENCNWLKGE